MPDEMTENTDQILAEVLGSAPTQSETANALLEVYERVERVYRLAMLSGQPAGGAAIRTDDFTKPI